MPTQNPYTELAERLVAALPDTVVLQLNGLMTTNRKRLSKEIKEAFDRRYPRGKTLEHVFAAENPQVKDHGLIAALMKEGSDLTEAAGMTEAEVEEIRRRRRD